MKRHRKRRQNQLNKRLHRLFAVIRRITVRLDQAKEAQMQISILSPGGFMSPNEPGSTEQVSVRSSESLSAWTGYVGYAFEGHMLKILMPLA